MSEFGPEASMFDLARFQSELEQQVARFSEVAYNPSTEEERAKVQEQKNELITGCVDALLRSEHTEEVEQIIHRVVLWHQYGNGHSLFSEKGRTDFAMELAVAVAKEAKKE